MKAVRYAWLLAVVVAMMLVASQSAQATGKQNRKKPNILFIMADDHASAAISCYGSWLKDVAKTPNLDKLAKDGMRFTNCVVTNSICTPSRAAILTGQYSHKNGVFTLNDPIDPNRRHLGHLMQAAGYRTGMIGKWHLHSNPQGFDYWNILPGQGVYRNPVLITEGKKRTTYKGKYSTDVIADLAMAWIKKQSTERPFFLMCHFKAPHRPWDPADRFLNLYKDVKIPEPKTLLDQYENRSSSAAKAKLRVGENMVKRDLEEELPKNLKGLELRRWAYQRYMKRYLACVAAVDENVGRLLRFLEAEGLAENTIVIYTSDQGFFLGEHGFYDKRFMYEPCLTTPLIIRYPGHTKGGTVNNDLVMNIDFAPTILDFAGQKAPKNMQGRSLRSLLEGSTPQDWRKSMYYHYYMHLAHHWVPVHYGVRTDRYTLIHYYGTPKIINGKMPSGSINVKTANEWELFDRKKDPEQLRNVYRDPEYAEVVRELRQELTRLKNEVEEKE